MSPPTNLPENYSGLELDFHTLANHIPQLAWMARPDGHIFWYNRRWYEYTGTTLDDVRGSGWVIVHHPDHLQRVAEGFYASLQSGEPWEDIFPLRRHDGEWRWFLSRALPVHDLAGNVIRWFGTNTDVTEQKEIEDRHIRLMREVDHRAKNALAVAQAVVKLSSAATIEQYKLAVESRIAALTRAHAMLADAVWEGADLRALINSELSAREGDKGCIDISGEAVHIDPSFGQPMALLFNELVANAERFGALGCDHGKLYVEWQMAGEDRLSIEWREEGLDGITAPGTRGFGLTVLERIIRQQLRGTVESRWNADGVSYHIALPIPHRER